MADFEDKEILSISFSITFGHELCSLVCKRENKKSRPSLELIVSGGEFHSLLISRGEDEEGDVSG